jgi:NADP-dependent 3-hydroxy acid dehydrogenase YdfG
LTSVSVVTGAGGAMGSACAFALTPAVDVLLLTDIDSGRLAATAEHIERDATTKVCTVAGNLGEPAFVADLARTHRRTLAVDGGVA